MPSILIVDDETAVRRNFVDRLIDEGYQVYEAVNGIDGYEKAKEFCPDLIVSDISMPKMDGIDFFNKLQADCPELAAIPFIFLTAKSGIDNAVVGMNLGADGYLAKPVRFDLLSATIKSRLNYHNRQAALLKSKLISVFNPIVEDDEYLVGEYESLDTLFNHYSQITKDAAKSIVDFNLVVKAQFRFRTLDEARQVAANLASQCPDPDSAIVGIIEMIVNGIEHGNLDVGYKLKTQLLKDGTWAEEIERRLDLPENINKSMEVTFIRQKEKIQFEFIDCGTGFRPEAYFDFNPMRAHDFHGRGIALANAIGFDDLRYEGSGNKAIGCINKNSK